MVGVPFLLYSNEVNVVYNSDRECAHTISTLFPVVRNDITLSETTLLVIQDPSFLQGTNIMLTTLGSSSIRHEQ